MKIRSNAKFHENPLKYKISLKSVQRVTSCSVGKGGRTDMTNLILAFSNFAKRT